MGATDGACDADNVVTYYQNNAAGHPVNLNDYAAGLCKQTISGFNDWYLPAVCEMGDNAPCGTPASPTAQNMEMSLNVFNSLNLLSGKRWSSTGYINTGNPSDTSILSWLEDFSFPTTAESGRNSSWGVRCV